MTKGIRPLAVAVAVAAAAGMAGSAQAANGVDTTALQKAVNVGSDNTGIRRHLKALQLIADRPGNNHTRATATQGHEDSVDYVEQQLATAPATGRSPGSRSPLRSSRRPLRRR